MSNPSEVNLRSICPFCESITQSGRIDGKFYIRPDTGTYICFHCHAKGMNLKLLETLEVIEEVKKKPLDLTVVKDFNKLNVAKFEQSRGLSYCSELEFSPKHNAIAIINRDLRTNEIIGIKYRSLLPDSSNNRYSSEPGSLNEGFWLKGPDDTKLAIVEGEIDALSLRDLGFSGFILATQTNRLSESQLNEVKRFKYVFTIPDNDLGGTQLENSTQSLLGVLNTIIKLPAEVKDINEFLIKDLETSRQFVKDQLRTALERDTVGFFGNTDEMIDFLSNSSNLFGTSTGFSPLDKVLAGGIRDKEFTVISALMKVGKTSFINNLIHNSAKLGKRIAVASFEMDGPTEISPSILSIAGQFNFRSLQYKDLLTEAAKQLSKDCSYLNNITYLRREGDANWIDVMEWFESISKSNKYDYLILDHVGFLTEDIKDASVTRRLSREIKSFGTSHDVKIIATVQQGRSKEGLGMLNADGGIGWAQACHNFITLQRNKENNLCLEVRLSGARYAGCRVSNDPIHLFYDPDTCSLNE